MPGLILTVLDHPEIAPCMLSAAQFLAMLSSATRINVLAIRIPPMETILPTEEILSRKNEIRIRAEEQHRADALKAIFDAWAGTAQQWSLATEWFDVEGRADEVIEEWGCRADVLAIKRPRHRDAEPDRQAIRAALFACGRAVLVVPPEQRTAPFGRRVAIAWRNDKRTTKAVLAAERWLGGADHVDVLAGTRDGMLPPPFPEILEEHGIKADLHVLPIPNQKVFGEVLLAKAHELASDMLVMGAYARHPVRSLILGGVTRYMLAHADLPVLMRH